MKPIAAIWRFCDTTNQGRNAGPFPVVIVAFITPPTGAIAGYGAGSLTQVVVVDSSRRLRTTTMDELEIVDDGVIAALVVAQERAVELSPRPE